MQTRDSEKQSAEREENGNLELENIVGNLLMGQQ
jgi:hypothetical protein